MDNPTVREVLEKVYSCEVESDSKDKERILAQAESALDALYKAKYLGMLKVWVVGVSDCEGNSIMSAP